MVGLLFSMPVANRNSGVLVTSRSGAARRMVSRDGVGFIVHLLEPERQAQSAQEDERLSIDVPDWLKEVDASTPLGLSLHVKGLFWEQVRVAVRAQSPASTALNRTCKNLRAEGPSFRTGFLHVKSLL